MNGLAAACASVSQPVREVARLSGSVPGGGATGTKRIWFAPCGFWAGVCVPPPRESPPASDGFGRGPPIFSEYDIEIVRGVSGNAAVCNKLPRESGIGRAYKSVEKYCPAYVLNILFSKIVKRPGPR